MCSLATLWCLTSNASQCLNKTSVIFTVNCYSLYSRSMTCWCDRIIRIGRFDLASMICLHHCRHFDDPSTILALPASLIITLRAVVPFSYLMKQLRYNDDRCVSPTLWCSYQMMISDLSPVSSCHPRCGTQLVLMSLPQDAFTLCCNVYDILIMMKGWIQNCSEGLCHSIVARFPGDFMNGDCSLPADSVLLLPLPPRRRTLSDIHTLSEWLYIL